MKIRMTVLLENQKIRREGLTEEIVVKAYQMLLDWLSIVDGASKATIEKAEFVEDILKQESEKESAGA